MPEEVVSKLQSLIENLILTHSRRVEVSGRDHLRGRLAEAIFVALGGRYAVRFEWGGGVTRVPPDDLVSASQRHTNKTDGENWSLEVKGLERLDHATLSGFVPVLDEAARRLEALLHARPGTQADRVNVSGIDAITFAERVLARLRRKFVEGGLVDEPTQVLFGIYRSDWRAFHLDRDIAEQLAAEMKKVTLDPKIREALEGRDVLDTLDHYLGLLCTEEEARGIADLLKRILDGDSEFNDGESIRSLLKLWSLIPNPRENTMTWSVLSEGCPAAVWEPVSFEQNPLQKLVVAIESSIGLFGEGRPFILIPIELFGQPRLVVYLMKVERPDEVLERTFWRGTWLSDIFSAFQTEFLARIQGRILAEPQADVWGTVIHSLPLFLNLTWVALDDKTARRREVYKVFQEREFVWQLRRKPVEDEVALERRLAEAANVTGEPTVTPSGDDNSLLVLPVGDSRLLVELEAPSDRIAPHIYAIWHLVQEAVQLARRQQDQTRRLIDFSTHDLNLLLDDLSSWTSEVTDLLKGQSVPDVVDLNFASAAMVHVGWTPLQMWRDTVGYLLEGPPVELKSVYDIAETLEWMHRANKARDKKTTEFTQDGVDEYAQYVPKDVLPLFHIIIYNVTHNAIKLAEKFVDLKVRFTGDEVEITCANDAARGDAERLVRLNDGVSLIKRGVVHAFEKLAKGSGILGWAMVAQNRLGPSGWDYDAAVTSDSSEKGRQQVLVRAKLSWGTN